MQGFPLEDYDGKTYGPLLGVSDEGSAAGVIAEAAYESAKAKARGGAADRAVVGIIVDGERMGSAGEVPIGPDEYAQILDDVRGRTFCTTNVGVRVNTRLLQPLPEFRVADALQNEDAWLKSVFAKFQPFINTPDGKPRPLTVRLLVDWNGFDQQLKALPGLVKKLEAGRQEGRLGARDLHRLSYLVVNTGLIGEETGPIEALIASAQSSGVPEVAVDGEVLDDARKRMSLQGLLNVLSQPALRKLKKSAKAAGVVLRYRYEDDEETGARTVWTGVFTARTQGFNGAKYGLLPLQFDQQRFVVGKVQRWMKGWTSIPAFYVDTPLVTEEDVIGTDRCKEAAKAWMKMAVEQGAKIVLVDSPDRVSPRRLAKTDGAKNDAGVLTIDEIRELQEYADGIGLRVLWSGGIEPRQAFDLARLGVFGIFTTSSAAKVIPVEGVLTVDPQLASAKEPTNVGVRRIHALIQAGYLCRVLSGRDADLVATIERQAAPLMAPDATPDSCRDALGPLDESLRKGWQLHWG